LGLLTWIIWFNPLKPSAFFMYHQVNIQKFYVVPTQRVNMFCMNIRTNSVEWLVSITETECVYFVVQTESLICNSG
jgi:hypothetical protein